MIERRAEWRVAPLRLKEWASPTLDSHAQPSCFYCHLLKLAAHPFTHMSEPAASRNVTGTFVNINNYSACIPKLLTSALPSPLSVRAAMCMCRRKVLQLPCTTMCKFHRETMTFSKNLFYVGKVLFMLLRFIMWRPELWMGWWNGATSLTQQKRRKDSWMRWRQWVQVEITAHSLVIWIS